MRPPACPLAHPAACAHPSGRAVPAPLVFQLLESPMHLSLSSLRCRRCVLATAPMHCFARLSLLCSLCRQLRGGAQPRAVELCRRTRQLRVQPLRESCFVCVPILAALLRGAFAVCALLAAACKCCVKAAASPSDFMRRSGAP